MLFLPINRQEEIRGTGADNPVAQNEFPFHLFLYVSANFCWAIDCFWRYGAVSGEGEISEGKCKISLVPELHQILNNYRVEEATVTFKLLQNRISL